MPHSPASQRHGALAILNLDNNRMRSICCGLLSWFPGLQMLSLDGNSLGAAHQQVPIGRLTWLSLRSNGFTDKTHVTDIATHLLDSETAPQLRVGGNPGVTQLGVQKDLPWCKVVD